MLNVICDNHCVHRAPRCWPLLAIWGLLLFCVSAVHAASNTVTLENASLRLELSTKQGGQLVALIDKQTGVNFLTPTSTVPLYAIDYMQGTVVKTVTSLTAQSITSSSTRRSTTKTLTLTFHHTASPPMDVVCRFTQDQKATEIKCSLSLTSSQSLTLKAIRFPVCAFPMHLGESASDDRLLLPHMDGLLLETPEQNMAENMRAFCDYPGTASLQTMGYYDDTGGVYFTTYDSDGYRKQLGFSRNKQLYSQLEHYPAVTAVKSYSLPYQIGIGVFHGDWQAVAEHYRQWALQQSWCRTPLAQRTDIPRWLLQAPLFYVIVMRGFTIPGSGLDYGQWLPQHIREYNAIFNTPVIPVIMGWEQHGYWITPDYFPPYGGTTAFQQMTAKLKADGNQSMAFLSGLKWTLQKTTATTTYDDQADFAKQGAASAILDQNGAPHTDGQPASGTGKYATLCPAVAATKSLMSSSVHSCQDLGLSAVQLDQLTGGWVPPCYATTHGHAPGGGNWSYTAVKTLLAQLRTEGKARNADFALMMEEPCELFIPVLDAYLSREYAENRWPREGKGLRGVPLFSYVYHEFSLGYGGDSVTIATGPQPQCVLSLAINLVDGKIPAAAVWERYVQARLVDAGQASMLRAALNMVHGYGHDYLLFGQRLATAPLDVPGAQVTCRNPSTNMAVIYTFPSVLFSGWQLRDGRIGFVLANHTGKTITTKVPLTGAPAGRKRYYMIRTWIPGQPEPEILAPRKTLPTSITVEIPIANAMLVEAIPL